MMKKISKEETEDLFKVSIEILEDKFVLKDAYYFNEEDRYYLVLEKEHNEQE